MTSIEVVWSVLNLLFQGILTSVFVLYIAKIYEDKKIQKQARAAAVFVSMEIAEHIMILAPVVATKKLLAVDSVLCFDISVWEDFRADIIPLVTKKELEKLAAYYRSIRMANFLISTKEPNESVFDDLQTALIAAKECCEFLRAYVED